MIDINNVALRVSMALIKEQKKHKTKCLHCKYMQNGLEKDGEVVIIHDPGCPMIAAYQLVRAFNEEIVKN